ncbi:MAG: glutamate formimidoyltransferase [Acidimicrobiales bacterium]
MLECVVNVSEGRDEATIAALSRAGGDHLLDVHSDPDHHRCVLTLAGDGVEGAARAVARVAVERIDIRRHHGAHPRLGALDVVPFVPVGVWRPTEWSSGDLADALGARDRFSNWVGEELGVPCFLYGPERALPEVRSRAFVDLEPDTGPDRPHASAGACAVGARFVLMAYNLWLSTAALTTARSIAASIRGPMVRALGMSVSGGTQVSCNLIDPTRVGPAQVYDAVAELAQQMNVSIVRAELVGLAPQAAVEAVPTHRRAELDLDLDRTIEARLLAGPFPG